MSNLEGAARTGRNYVDSRGSSLKSVVVLSAPPSSWRRWISNQAGSWRGMVGFTKLPRLVFGCLGRSPTCHAAKLGAGQKQLDVTIHPFPWPRTVMDRGCCKTASP